MTNRTTDRLPAPHDCIEVSVSHWYGDTWHVRYTGTPNQLVAAGIVDDDMVRKILSKKGGGRIGRDGFPFKLKSFSVPAHVQWARDEAVGFERKVRTSHQHKALQLPGVRELFPNGFPSQEDLDEAIRNNPGPGDRVCGSLSAHTCAYADAVGRVVSRARAIGRRQRIMHWSLINGTVIAPDWAWLVRERLTGGAA